MRDLMMIGAIGAIAGCFSPKFQEGLRCGVGEEPCPPGQRCDNGICRSMAGPGVDVPISPDDIDGDGVLNDSDNCPDIANPKQYDEDFDAIGNECDPCPISTTNTDSDMDSVGDACDPFPDIPGESIVLFEGFDDPLGPGWVFAGGDWAQGTGELAFQMLNDQVGYAIAPVFADSSDMVVAGFIADSLDPMFLNKGVGIGWLDPNAGLGLACTAGINNADQSPVIAILDHSTFQPLAASPLPWTPGTLNTLSTTRLRGTDYLCGLSGSAIGTIGASYTGPVPSMIAIGARSILGRYLYFMYVDVPEG